MKKKEIRKRNIIKTHDLEEVVQDTVDFLPPIRRIRQNEHLHVVQSSLDVARDGNGLAEQRIGELREIFEFAGKLIFVTCNAMRLKPPSRIQAIVSTISNCD